MEAATAARVVAKKLETELVVRDTRPSSEQVWDALVEFTTKHGPELKRRLRYAVGDSAEDVYQDTLISVQSALPAAALDQGQLANYVYRAAYRCATRRAQKEGRDLSLDIFEEHGTPVQVEEVSSERTEQFDRMAKFGEAVASLPSKERRALIMRTAGQMKVKDIAGMIGEDYRHTRYLIDHAAKIVAKHMELVGEGQVCDQYQQILRQSVFGELSMGERLRLRTHLTYCSACRHSRAELLDVSRAARLLLPPIIALPYALDHAVQLGHGMESSLAWIYFKLASAAQKLSWLVNHGFEPASSGQAIATIGTVAVVAAAAPIAANIERPDVAAREALEAVKNTPHVIVSTPLAATPTVAGISEGRKHKGDSKATEISGGHSPRRAGGPSKKTKKEESTAVSTPAPGSAPVYAPAPAGPGSAPAGPQVEFSP